MNPLKSATALYTFTIAIATFATVVLLLSGCTTVRVPRTDSSPPTIRLGTIGLDDDVLVTEASEDIEIAVDRSDRFTVMATAEDRNGGVSNVNISFSQTIYCPGSASHGDGYVHNPADGIVGSTVPTTRTVAKSVEMNEVIENARGTCEDFRSIVFTFRGIALNFHDGRADSARITATYRPD